MSDTFIQVGNSWVRCSEIVAVTDNFNDRTASPRWESATVRLRDGREIKSRTRSATTLLSLMAGDPDE